MGIENLNKQSELKDESSKLKNGQFDVDKRILEDVVGFKAENKLSTKNFFDFDKRTDVKDDDVYYTTREERIEKCPKNDCKWTGDRGESKCISNNAEINKKLEKYGVDGIEYRAGIVDFSPVAIEKVQISMTSDRYTPETGNFPKADSTLAKQWNEQKKDGKTDWKASDVTEYRQNNNLTWHECSDMKTCMLVDRDIHGEFKHPGGVMECKRKEAKEGKEDIFDE